MKLAERLKNETIQHYERMIAWAEKQDQEEFKDEMDMFDSLGESWNGMSCIFCIVHDQDCEKCELNETHLCHYPWHSMQSSVTWGEWVEQAKHFLILIKGVEL